MPQLAATADENDRDFFGALTAAEEITLRKLVMKLVRAHELRGTPIDLSL